MPTEWSLIQSTDDRVVVERLELAAGFWSRLRGLQFRATLPAEHGLLLAPCSSIHTCFLRFAIDVVFLSAEGRVLGIRQHVRPWRLALAKRGTQAVLEMPAGTANLNIGDFLFARSRSPGATPPKSLRFFAPESK